MNVSNATEEMWVDQGKDGEANTQEDGTGPE
jgi:hypothetical protein